MVYFRNYLLWLTFLIGTSFTIFHHGWAEYNQERVLDFKTTIEESIFENPHSLVKVKFEDQIWTVYLAPTSRMADRGLSAVMIKKGAVARLVAYPHKTIKTEMRAERIFVNGKKFELR